MKEATREAIDRVGKILDDYDCRVPRKTIESEYARRHTGGSLLEACVPVNRALAWLRRNGLAAPLLNGKGWKMARDCNGPQPEE